MAVDKVKTGVDGLDEVIGGGFPRGSLILLAGGPGTGKTVFAMQFLAGGCRVGEPGVYVSFAESKKTLIENVSRHIGVDLGRLVDEGKLKILDFTAVREKGVSDVLNFVLDEVRAVKAKRLVIDSFSAMAQAFESPIDVRIVVHLVLSQIVRAMGCTTLMIEEVPIGKTGIGLGMEEFVADGIILLRSDELEGYPFRDLEIVKLRGVRLGQRKLVFTLEGGFKVYPQLKPKPIERPKRFQPTPDLPDRYSTGSRSLDEALGGGLPKASVTLLELDEKVSRFMYHLLLAPLIANFVLQGRGVLIVPLIGADPLTLRKYIGIYGGTEEDWKRYVRIVAAKSLDMPKDLPNIIMLNAEDWKEDRDKVVKASKQLAMETNKPNLTIIGIDTLATLYGGEKCVEILNLSAAGAKSSGATIVAVIKAGYRDLAVKLSPIADIYLRLTREHGCLLLYGVKPRTGLYAVEMDVSRGYPLPELTQIV